MSSSNPIYAPEQLCYIPCNLCNMILAVPALSSSSAKPNSKPSFFGTVMENERDYLRCLPQKPHSHCSNLCSINMAASFQSRAGKDIQVPKYTSSEYRIELSSSSRVKTKLPKRPTTTVQQRVVNRPPEKRHRAPSLYNQFIKEEIQRIKMNNPDISHREAFSTAAKNLSLTLIK
ncbi:Axial regulator YABBY 5 [Hibiscus syriacus]|uniref:Axial regulator YABBY 5 n=1 Tax=Hibiscus syriacus TaxID=106335 RepID=A0A6A2ZKP6_HIBSY|nr:Axial regulator YABBY 5 [Hibiscus syriacus]